MSLTQLAEANVAESPDSEQILCFYANFTSEMQIARIANIPTCHFQKVIFPGQRLLFEAVPEAQLEIQTFLMDKKLEQTEFVVNILKSMKARIGRQINEDYVDAAGFEGNLTAVAVTKQATVAQTSE